MNRVYIKTYGCQMNERDSEAVAAMLRDRGYTLVDREEEADVVLLNTCSVRDQAELKAVGKAGYLFKRKRSDPAFRVGIIGCMAQNRGADLLRTLPDLDLLAGTQKFHRVPDLLDNLLATERGLGPRPATLVELDEEFGSQNAIRGHWPDRRQVTAYVSIMQGCDMQCSFCIVPKTRGSERSRTVPDLLEETRQLTNNGTREVTLLGQIVTSYGRGLIRGERGRSPFVQLLEALSDVPGLARLRFTSPHPRGFKNDLIQAFGRLPKLMPHVHLPVQSGSDRILRMMNRPYTAARYRKIIDDLRTVRPEMAFSTDIIVGFPGETEADFADTRRLFAEVGFDMAFIFKYSTRTGTPAATMPDQVAAEVKDARHQVLLRLLEEQSLRKNQAMLGTDQEVLIEGPARRGKSILEGRTPNNRKVLFTGPPDWIGRLAAVHIEKASVTALLGKVTAIENGQGSLDPLPDRPACQPFGSREFVESNAR